VLIMLASMTAVYVILFLPQLRTCLALVPPVRCGPALRAPPCRAGPACCTAGLLPKVLLCGRRSVLLVAV